MTIHTSHPFLPEEPERDPVRRFRGRLAAGVTLWTSGAGSHGRAGLTVSSVLVAAGEPARVLALLDPDSDLCERLEQTGAAVVHLLAPRHRDLADAFAGVAPAPGGAFRLGDFADGPAGPVLADASASAVLALEEVRDVGWSRLVTCTVAEVKIRDGADDAPLVHHRGRYRRLGSGDEEEGG